MADFVFLLYFGKNQAKTTKKRKQNETRYPQKMKGARKGRQEGDRKGRQEGDRIGDKKETKKGDKKGGPGA